MTTTTIGFIGLGLIGGSIAKAIRKFHPEYRICAYTHTAETLEKAVAAGVIDVPCMQIDEHFSCVTISFSVLPCAQISLTLRYSKN